MARARAGIALLTESGISSIMARVSARPRRFRREDAQAGPGRRPGGGPCFNPIRYGCLSRMTNNDLVRLACEQADAQILYKPHPDVLARRCAPSTTSTRSPRLRASRRSCAGSGVTTAGPVPSTPDRGLTNDRQPNPRRRRSPGMVRHLRVGASLRARDREPAALEGAAECPQEIARAAAPGRLTSRAKITPLTPSRASSYGRDHVRSA